MMRRRVAAMIALLWLAHVAAASAALCAGWQSTPIKRAACCKGAGHHCPMDGQRAADQCCAQAEQSQHGFTAKASSALAKPTLVPVTLVDLPSVAPLPARYVVAAARTYDTRVLIPPHPSPHILFSVFRV
jgi:hypothetical protein